MAKHDNISKGNKKHIALSLQEQKQQKIIMISLVAAAVLIVGAIAIGLLNEFVFKYNQPVATINDEKILPAEFEKQVRFNRSQLLQQYLQYQQLAQMFGNDPQMGGQFTETLEQIQLQLLPDGTITVGNNVLDQLTNQILINQEAEKLGVSISDEQLNEAFQAAFGYYPGGTPTPQPTATKFVPPTLSPEQIAIITLTPTLEPTETLPTTAPENVEEPTPTSEPLPTATAYTETMFSEELSAYLDLLNKLGVGFTEADLRHLIHNQLIYEEVRDTVTADVADVEEQIWARHILVPDLVTAQVVLDSLGEGVDWTQLASELSLDTSNKENGGDLGWFSRGQMVGEFEDAAFALQIGEISEPVETQFGVHIIQVIGREDRPLDASIYQNKVSAAFETWMNTVKENSTIDISGNWTDFIPEEPALNQETLLLLQGEPQQ